MYSVYIIYIYVYNVLRVDDISTGVLCVFVCICSIGRGTGYRSSELSGLVEGSTLVIGGKEIEVCQSCMAT